MSQNCSFPERAKRKFRFGVETEIPFLRPVIGHGVKKCPPEFETSGSTLRQKMSDPLGLSVKKCPTQRGGAGCGLRKRKFCFEKVEIPFWVETEILF